VGHGDHSAAVAEWEAPGLALDAAQGEAHIAVVAVGDRVAVDTVGGSEGGNVPWRQALAGDKPGARKRDPHAAGML
jgi:hypothetical protein